MDGTGAIILTEMPENLQILEQRLLKEEIELTTTQAKVTMGTKPTLRSNGKSSQKQNHGRGGARGGGRGSGAYYRNQFKKEITETLRKEIYAGLETERRGSASTGLRESQTASDEKTDEPFGTFLLNSGANPSFI